MPDPETKSTWDEERKMIRARRALEISRGADASPDDGAVVAAGMEDEGEEG